MDKELVLENFILDLFCFIGRIEGIVYLFNILDVDFMGVFSVKEIILFSIFRYYGLFDFRKRMCIGRFWFVVILYLWRRRGCFLRRVF